MSNGIDKYATHKRCEVAINSFNASLLLGITIKSQEPMETSAPLLGLSHNKGGDPQHHTT
jgi:hypothetical protein